MRQSKVWSVCLVAAGLFDCGMAFTHFGLQYEWSGVDGGSLPAQLLWALFALNFSWAVLVLGVGGLMLYAARLDPIDRFVRATVFIVGVFWTIHSAYVWLVPMPLPARLQWLNGPILAFPMMVVALHAIALLATRASHARVVRSPLVT
jgi:hypothetical protein